MPSERIRICKSQSEIEELEPESTDIFKRNIIERYMDRPDSIFGNGRFHVIDKLCLAMFVAHYYVDYKPINENDSQAELLPDDLHTVGVVYSIFPLFYH